MDIIFDKLYRYDRKAGSYIAIPVKKGELKTLDKVQILDGVRAVPIQKKITARYDDGSVKYMFLRFLAELPANEGKVFSCDFNSERVPDKADVVCEKEADSLILKNKFVKAVLKDNSNCMLDSVKAGGNDYSKEQFAGPYLKTGKGAIYEMHFDKWSVIESGDVFAKAVCRGEAEAFMGTSRKETEKITFECNIELWAESSELEISFRLINSTSELLHVASLVFSVLKGGISKEKAVNITLEYNEDIEIDSTGCGDLKRTNIIKQDIYTTTGIKELPDIEARFENEEIKTCAARSNYKTNFWIGRNGAAVECVADAELIIKEANEHFAEVFYGTFFADRTDSSGGVCATIYQAQQNFPKAVKADSEGVYIMLVPEGVDKIEMESGMSREQKFMLHFHDKEETLTEIDNLSLMYQMKDRPYIKPYVFKEANVMPDIFVDADKMSDAAEITMIGKCDGHARSYGMLCFGDAPDMNYTTQGRGKGMLVWSNNEYDYPHACAMQYARTGVRRFMDYMIAAARHWMDVDICHYSKNPLEVGGQWEHTRRHVKDGVMVCSHEWVEGLLDYYHFTGDERGLTAALGIGNNILALLELPMYQNAGESSARETGWALRTLTALYFETYDKKWLSKCEWIVGHFKKWHDDYGNWLAPYTDNTLIRVGFMISVAIGSLMRYYRIFPSEDLKEMMLSAVDDLIENAMLPNGLFYYKELPSLNRLGNNALLLEAVTIGYELSGDKKYLSYGIETFRKIIRDGYAGNGGAKRHMEDAVITNGDSTKNFAQTFLPFTVYYSALAKEDMLKNI